MKALSVRQPWAWLEIQGFKPLENRSRVTMIRGRVAIHASLAFDWAGYRWVQEQFPEIAMPAPDEFERGGIIGTVEIWDVVEADPSPWFFGPKAYCLREPKVLPLIPCKGKLGFFEVDELLKTGVA